MSYTLRHLTLATGHISHPPLDRIDPGELAETLALLPTLTGGARRALPRWVGAPGYEVFAARQGAGLLATVLAPDGIPVMTTGVVRRSLAARAIWDALTTPAADALPLAPGISRPPAPWVADLLRVGMTRHMDTADWSARWSATLAWAWMEYRDDPAG